MITHQPMHASDPILEVAGMGVKLLACSVNLTGTIETAFGSSGAVASAAEPDGRHCASTAPRIRTATSTGCARHRIDRIVFRSLSSAVRDHGDEHGRDDQPDAGRRR